MSLFASHNFTVKLTNFLHRSDAKENKEIYLGEVFYISYVVCHCGMRDKSSMFLSPVFKNLIFFYDVVFNAELNGTIGILCFDLLWPARLSWATVGQ